ncbi:nocobactin polyketide synthase NbtC [Nocardia brasiliensis]|uniref:nocobactin polyketide synthase NbtC n=1 Tax=Nocardia brasiliensis TaxID=37326 RepID=UPI00366FD52B
MSSYRMPDGTIPILLSSDSADGVRREAATILSYLDDHQRVAPDQVSDMLFRTRLPRRYRALALVSSRVELLDGLRSVATGTAHPAVLSADAPATPRRIGFVFPGQGSQRPGMGRLYYDASPEYRAAVDECAGIHEDRFGHSKPVHYLLANDGHYDDTLAEIQPSLMFHMTGLAAMWQAAGVRPSAVIGHSQGELAAGAVSGVMSLRDAVLAVTHRARLVSRISPSGYSMAVLGMDRDECEALLARHSGWAELSVINSPHILAISGDRDTIVDMVATANAKGRFAKEIRVSYPAHTSLVSEYRAELEAALGDEMSSRHFAATDVPAYGSTLGGLITPELVHQQYWYWNLRNRVRFDRAVVAAATDGVDTLIEIAEHPMLQLALQENLTLVPQQVPARDFRVLGTSLRTAQGLREFTRNLAAVAILDLNYRWDALRRGHTAGAPVLPLRDFPHTVMNPKRLWASPGSSADNPVLPAPTRPPKPQRLVEKWTRVDRRSLVPPRRIAVVDHTGRCGDLAAALCTAADRHGATAHMFDEGAIGDFDTVVVLLPPLADTGSADAIADIAEFFAERTWLPALDRLRPGAGAECWLVTVGGEAVLDGDPVPQLFHGAVSSGFRSVGVERTGVLLRHLDLAVTEAGPDQAAKVIAAVHTRGEHEMALRGGKIYVKQLVPENSDESTTHGMDLDHVLIVGGTGQLGLRFCEHFTKAGAGRITLVSRTGESDSVGAELRRIRGLGNADIAAISCDVSDEDAVRRLAADCADRPVSLLIHAAVNYIDAELAEITAEMVTVAAGSKVVGLETVLRSVPRTTGCRVLLCSSLAATLSGRGQILYAVTNRMLDITARTLREQGVDSVSLQWGLWSVAGPLDAAGVARAESTGVIPMDPNDAIAVGLTEHWGDAVVLSADWQVLREVAGLYGQAAVFSSLVAEPETSAVAPTLGEPTAVVAAPSGDAAVDKFSLSTRMLAELVKVMGTDGPETIDSAVPLVALGLDSLQALDLRKRIKSELDRDLPVAAILGGASLNDVVLLMAENTHQG